MRDKQSEIINMFNDIAKSYDMANRAMSMGVDLSWRKEACKEAFKILNKKSLDIVDVACGTGDMIMHWQSEAKEHDIAIDSMVGIDPSSGMLEVAKEKIPNIHLQIAQADNLPLESNSKDILSIAYGLRNVVNRKGALMEFYRVLKPGGVVVILEFTSQKSGGIASSLMQLYTKKILPIIGGIISGNFKAYKYLPNSIDSFVTTESLQEELSLHGMNTAFSKAYSAGVSTLIIARK